MNNSDSTPHLSKILIVDDTQADHDFLIFLLNRIKKGGAFPDIEVQHAFTGLDGLALVPQSHPDCILLDVNLPDMDGSEFITTLHAEGDIIPSIVVLTGQLDPSLEEVYYNLGAGQILLKDVKMTAEQLLTAMLTAAGHMPRHIK